MFSFWAVSAVAWSGMLAVLFAPAVRLSLASGIQNPKSCLNEIAAPFIAWGTQMPDACCTPDALRRNHTQLKTQHLQDFNVIGVISGLLFVLATGCSFVAISLIGSVAIATGMWCGVAMCTSYFSGVLAGECLNAYLSLPALVLMIYSVYRISCTSQASHGCALKHACNGWQQFE